MGSTSHGLSALRLVYLSLINGDLRPVCGGRTQSYPKRLQLAQMVFLDAFCQLADSPSFALSVSFPLVFLTVPLTDCTLAPESALKDGTGS